MTGMYKFFKITYSSVRFASNRFLIDVDDAVKIYRDLAKIPSVKSGRIVKNAGGGAIRVESVWSQRNLERKETVVFTREHIIYSDVIILTAPAAVNSEQWNRVSPSGKLTAVVRKVKDKKGEDKQYIEIWSGAKQVENFDVQALDKHGKIYEDDQFGCLEWSHSETSLLYVAEKKCRKTKSYFDVKSDAEPSDATKPTESDVGDEFLYKECWGEQLNEKYHPVLCVLDITTGNIDVVTSLPDDVSPGQAVWCADDLGVVCVGWWHVPYRLGLVYCTNRRSALFHVDLKASVASILGSSDRAVRSPVFSHDGSKLVYLDCSVGGPHLECSRIMKLEWSSKTVSTVFDIVGNVQDTDCPGIYTQALNKQCWLRDGRRIILDSHWRSKIELVIVDTETGKLERLTNSADVGSWQLLGLCDDHVLAACASPNQPQYLVVGQLSAGDVIHWQRLDSDTSHIDEISWSITSVSLPHINPAYNNVNYDYILLETTRRSGSDVKPPLVVFPHGGPHSAFVADFTLYTAGLVACGYAVLLVNYRGSYGFGQDNIESLLGHVGTQDVNDIQHVVEMVLNAGIADRDRVVVIGGSHGGFLTAHLIGQFPTFYKAAVARNLVFNIASMFGITDIPDWAVTESGDTFDDKMTGSPELYAEMWKRSPVVHIDKMKTPLMVMIGGKDLRVPPSQGLQLKRALEARNVPVRVLWYPECSHPITEVSSEADAFINIIKWFREHTQ